MSEALTSITGVVASVAKMMTTGDLAIFFWSGLVFTGIAVVKKLKK